VIRVLVVDDSAVVRKVLSEQLAKYPDIDVVGTAIDPYNARELIVRLRPDVVTLDVEMPRMDGLSFLARLMKHFPLPVVVVSSLTPRNSETAIRALELGAVEVICKPGGSYSTAEIARPLAHAIRAAARARPARLQALPPAPLNVRPAPSSGFELATTNKVLAIGATTGGTSALEVVLSGLPSTAPGTVIVQHMPESFTAAFAARLNNVSAMEVREARNGDLIVNGLALLAPGNKHLIVQRNGARYVAQIKDGPAVHHQRPAVDPLFESVAASVGRNAVGVILTGMGSDGASGLLAMRQRGARTLAQDEKSCVVFGMPMEAIKLGAAEEIIPLSHMAGAIMRVLSEESKAA
jgi:two-component system, chemotaxis family, protein-glutamate methylesterase/glutaminase